MDKIIVGLISSFSTLVVSYLVFRKDDKANQLKYITEERQKWREKIRELSVIFMSGKYDKDETTFKTLSNIELINIREQVAVRLNPSDPYDKYILCLMDCYIEDGTDKDRIRKELSVAFASLLKHDWDRVKNETKMESNASKMILFLISTLIISCIYYCLNLFPKTINFFTFDICMKNGKSFSDLHILYFITYVLSILLFYQLLKYFRWRRKYRMENDLSCFFCKKKSKTFCCCYTKKTESLDLNENAQNNKTQCNFSCRCEKTVEKAEKNKLECCVCEKPIRSSSDSNCCLYNCWEDSTRVWNKYLGYTIRK